MAGDDADPGLATRARTAWRSIALGLMALAGVAIAVALVWTLSGANAQRDRALALQSHSYDVMILARRLSGTINRSEASLGRYVISGDQQLGRRYYEEWNAAGDQLNQLDRVTADNGRQQRLISELRRAYAHRGQELSLTALSITYKKNAQAFSRYYQAGTSTSIGTIDQLLDRIIDGERGLLDRRTSDAMLRVRQSNVVAGVLAMFGVLILLAAIALGWLTWSAMQLRARAEADAEEERARASHLQAAVTAATEALHAQEAKLRQAQKMDAVGKLTGGIAHDFNNMLAVVLGGLELARRALANDPALARRHLDNAAEGANRAAALTRRLLAFSREEALNPEPLTPGGAIAGMTDLLDRTLGDGVQVSVADRAGDWRIWTDRHELENTVLNLAVNARDAMDGRGRLDIAVDAVALAAGEVNDCTAGDYVAIAVSDAGCGMSQEVLDRAFEPFFTTKPVGKGTGLGLTQIFGFARQSDGTVAIRTAPGEGTTVTLYLPRHGGSAMPASAATLDVLAPATSAPALGSLGILVVEDDHRVLAATMGALAELGHRALGCGDPLLAPAMVARDGPFDLIISDVLMPSQTGPEMVAGLLGAMPGLAVLFVTGFAGDGPAAAGFGGRVVLRKPFTIAALERAIGEAMAADRPVAPHQLAAE